MAGRVLFIYRGKRGTCSLKTIYRKLHGYTGIRIKKTDFGRVEHKPYSYPGIPHQDIIKGVFFVAAKDAGKITEFFGKYRVPFIRTRPREVKVSNWRLFDEKLRR